MKYYIGMDVGATTMRIRIADETGNLLVEHEGEGGTVNVAGYEYVAAVYRRELEAALAKKGLSKEDCACLCAGACGVDSPALREKYIQLVSEAGFPKERLKIYNDCEVLLHTQEDENMIAVVSGTGSIMMGRRPDGQEARFGGRGHLLGDEGSAFYLVKEAVIRLIHYMDGYGDCEYMLRRFSEVSGMKDPIEIARYYQRYCVSEKNNISQYAPVVSEAAEHGDPGALEVMESAAQGLYMGVVAVANALGFTAKDPIHVVYWGSILEKVPLISSRLTELIHTAYPCAVTGLPDNSAVGIALDIAMQN